jgi:hypothetical protein
MKKEEPQLSCYDFTFVGLENNSYIFETFSKITYEIQFRHTPYLFSKDFIFSEFTYEFVISVSENAFHGRPPFDVLTSKTIANIFEDFYRKYDETVTIYVCDSSDNRQMVRHRKFNIWFEEFNDDKFLKIDVIFKDEQGSRFPSSLILKKDNPFRTQIFDEYVKVSDSFNK